MRDRNEPTPVPVEHLGWFGSVRVGGLLGGRFARQPVTVAANALERGVRGARRQQRARERLVSWTKSLGDELSFTDLAGAMAAGHLTDLGTPGREVFIDLELDQQGHISEIGAAIWFDRQLLVAAGRIDDLGSLSSTLRNRWVVAHNGAAHDFPILEKAGALLPTVRLDSLQLAHVAWPDSEAHSLGFLADAHNDEAAEASKSHHAGYDARTLATLWKPLTEALSRIPSDTQQRLHDTLVGELEQDALHHLLPSPSTPPATGPWGATKGWREDSGAAHATGGLDAGAYPLDQTEAAFVPAGDIRAAFIAHSGAGALARPWRVLDPDRLNEIGDPWCRAVAIRLCDVAAGMVDRAPLPHRESMRVACRQGDRVLILPGQPLLVTASTVVAVQIRRPLVVEGLWRLFSHPATDMTVRVELPDGLPTRLRDLPRSDRAAAQDELAGLAPTEQLRDAARHQEGLLIPLDDGSVAWHLPMPDPIAWSHGLRVHTSSPLGRGRSAPLWEHLFGTNAHHRGTSAVQRGWRLLDGVPGSRQFPGRRTVQLLAIAAVGLTNQRSALVVDDNDNMQPVKAVAAGLWREHTGAGLLRPPDWPTIDEASRRLREPVVGLVHLSASRALAQAADDIFLATAPGLSNDHPTVERLLREAGDEAFAMIAEPLRAHLTAEYVCDAASETTICDIGYGETVLSELLGNPQRTTAEAVESDTAIAEALLAAFPVPARRDLHPSDLRAATRRLLGPDRSLRDFQEAIIADVAAGHDTLGVYRTGLGKSLCYQVPALAYASTDAVTIVVSPLLSLQRDQVEDLRDRGIHEVALYNSELTTSVRRSVLQGLRSGFYRVVLLAPEALRSPAVTGILRDQPIRLLVIDEAHCISEMGHDFRPDYRTLPRAIRTLLGLPPHADLDGRDGPTLLALTGTASPEVRDDIIGALT